MSVFIRLQSLARRAGVDLRRWRPLGPRRATLLEEHGIKNVLDVGAHVGGYATELRSHGYRGRIISFEPNSVVLPNLRAAAAQDSNWTISEVALSNQEGTATLHVADVFTSLTTPTEDLLDVFPDARPTTTVQAQTARLDSFPEYLDLLDHPTLLKIDTQGSEKPVLDGLGEQLKRVELVEMELSIVPVYDGQALMAELVHHLDDHGFRLVDIDPIGRDNRTGAYLQCDGIFARV